MLKNKNITTYTLEDVLLEIKCSLESSTKRILATHFLGNESDLTLPPMYLEALKTAKCSDRKRIIFGDKNLFDKFYQAEELGFQNFYTDRKDYQRMLLIDDTVYFKSDTIFYKSKDPKDILKFLEYFNNIDTL